MGRIADGLFELLAGESVVFVRGFGKSSAPRFFEDVTGFLVKNDIASALNKWRLIADRYIDVVSVSVEEVGENVAKVSYFPVDGVPSFITFREVQAGNIEWLVEANGGKNEKAEFLSEEREGKQACIIKVVWE